MKRDGKRGNVKRIKRVWSDGFYFGFVFWCLITGVMAAANGMEFEMMEKEKKEIWNGCDFRSFGVEKE